VPECLGKVSWLAVHSQDATVHHHQEHARLLQLLAAEQLHICGAVFVFVFE